MCWYCCISLRGAVYFGTSVHIFVGLMLFLRWIVFTYIAGFVTHKLLTDASVLIWTVLSGMYFVFFVICGCLIFAGTERKSVSVLKWSAAGFICLQLLVFTVMLILYLIAPGGWNLVDPDITYEMRILTIAMFFFCLVSTTNYVIVLALYIRKLWHLKKGRSPSLNNIRISRPMAPQLQNSERGDPRLPSTYAVSYHRRGNSGSGRPPPGPESPGIYESLDNHSVTSQHPFYPPNFYASSYRRGTTGEEGLYGGGGGGSLSGSQRGNYQRAYPYPHQRHPQPLTEEEEDWERNYPGQRVHIFQRGQPHRTSTASNSTVTHPLLQQPQY